MTVPALAPNCDVAQGRTMAQLLSAAFDPNAEVPGAELNVSKRLLIP
jgi:hypothetical protein